MKKLYTIFIVTLTVSFAQAQWAGFNNNGGDGLAIARLLEIKDYDCQVYVIGDIKNASPEQQAAMTLQYPSTALQDHENPAYPGKADLKITV